MILKCFPHVRLLAFSFSSETDVLNAAKFKYFFAQVWTLEQQYYTKVVNLSDVVSFFSAQLAELYAYM